MTTTDARIAVGMPVHPKTKKLLRRLGPAGGWGFVCLILWTAANRANGDLVGMSVEDIELAADWVGEEGKFVATLTEVGFLDQDNGGFKLHDWAQHNPWAAGADARSAKARWNAAKRHYGEDEANRLVPEFAVARAATSTASSNAASIEAAYAQPHDSTAPSPNPVPSPNPYRDSDTSSSAGIAAAPAEMGKTAFGKSTPAKPHEVDPQIWADWLTLRKAKKAPVTQTALDSAKDEASKAGLSLEAFLRIWCARGSQGLQADWIKPAERSGIGFGNLETTYQRSMRERMTEAAPEFARRAPVQPGENPIDFFKTIDVPARTLEMLK